MQDNPWATAWDDPCQEVDADIAWSAHTTPKWPTTDALWVPSTTLDSQEIPLEEDITAQDQPRSISQLPLSTATEPSATDAPVSDQLVARCISPPRDSFCPVPETSDATLRSIVSVARGSNGDNLDAAINPPDDDWAVPWCTTTSSEANPTEGQAPDQWEAARQDKEKLNRAVPPDLLDSLLRYCQRVSQEVWPASETGCEDDWCSGFDDFTDITALLTQLVPIDSTLPPIVQFSATSTAKAMNEALKLTRHLPASASSPLSRLLASKGSLEWEKSIKADSVIVPDVAHVGWRVLEKEDRFGVVESKTRKVSGGLLSFWNRRASTIQAASVETPQERSKSPARSSLESVGSVPHPPSSHTPSLSMTSNPSVPPSSLPDSVLTAVPTPSAVSRFLNRFSRTKGAQHSSLALSSDDLEFLSDIVPSASDPPDEDINDGTWDAPTSVNNPSPLSVKLPPPIPPPPKHPISPTRLSAAHGLGTLDGGGVNGSSSTVSQMQGINQTPNIPTLDPPLSPKLAFSPAQSPSAILKDVAPPTFAFEQSSTPSIQHRLQPSSQPNSQPHSSFMPPPQKALSSLFIPPLLPPPPVSPLQTSQPSAPRSTVTAGHSSVMHSFHTSSFHYSYDPDDEFTAFTSLPALPLAPSPSAGSYPSRGSPSPPSPPPRRTYERTHYPSSSSTSSTFSPASRTSADQLYSSSSISASLNSFDDFVFPPSTAQGNNRKSTPSPPPLPTKPQSQPLQPWRNDTLPSRVYHAHTPSQTHILPTVHTSLLNNASSASSVSNAQHQRTQSLVDQAAARGGLLWPNSPQLEAKGMRAIPLPPSSFTSPKSLTGESFDLLDDGGLEALPPPLSMVGGMGMEFTVSSPATGALRTPFKVAGGREEGYHPRNQLQPSSPPLPSISTPIPSFSSQNTLLPATGTNTGSTQPPKPKQTGGLSAQDLSFFEGL